MIAGVLLVITLVVIGIALILASHWLTASDVAREKIAAETTLLTGGQLHYNKLALHLLPMPHLTALQVDFRIPGKVSLDIASLEIYPDLGTLLTGNVELEKLVIVRPSTRIKLPVPPSDRKLLQKTDTANRFKETLATVFGALTKLGPDLKIKVRDGTFGLFRPDKTELKVDRINLLINSLQEIVTLKLQCRSNVSTLVKFTGSVNLETRKSEGLLKLDGLNARALLAQLGLHFEMALSDTSAGLEMAFSAQAGDSVQARVSGQIPAVELKRQKRHVTLQKIDFKGKLVADARKLHWEINSLKVGSPGLELGGSGTYIFNKPTSPGKLDLDVDGQYIDVAGVAQSFTAIAGDLTWVRSAFEVARAGILDKASCSLKVGVTGGKWTVEDIRARGSLSGGLITIPDVGLDIEGVSGEVVLDNERVDFKAMKGRLPFGTFDKLDARIDWQKTAMLGISSSRATLTLEKFYPWLVALEGLKDLRENVLTTSGELNLTRLELSGPLTSPARWSIEVAAGVEDVTIVARELSGPLYLQQGQVNVKPQMLSFEKVHFNYLDADAVTTLTLWGTLPRPGKLDLTFDGTIGAQALGWASQRIAFPEYLRVQAPLQLSDVSLQWDDQPGATLAGEVITAAGTRVFADAVFAPGEWRVNRFELKDNVSDVSLKLARSAGRIDLDYSGNLQKATLDSILKENTVLKGWFAGNLKASYNIFEPRSSSLSGTVRGEGLVLPHLTVSPFELKQFSIECREQNARLESVDLIIAGTPLHLAGTAGVTSREYRFDLDLSADNFDAEVFNRIQKGLLSVDAEQADDKQEKLPINGTVRFKAQQFRFKKYTWTPLHANIDIRPGTVKAVVNRAELCGVSTPGSIKITPDGLHLDFKPVASNQNLQQTWECLQTKPLEADSRFNLEGQLESHGPAKGLVNALHGNLAFSSDKGSIHQSNILTQIFSILNITEVFAGKTSGLGEKGFGYDTIRARASIKAGVLNFDELFVDGHSMKISGEGTVNFIDDAVNVTLLVAPLKTIDRLVSKIPVVGYIAGGSLISVPIRIKGRLADPEVIPLPAGAIRRGLVGILERILETPL